MKKVAIVTISWGKNYGNKLQNYATQEVYKKMGYKVETIKFKPTIKRKNNSKISKLRGISLNKAISKLKRLICRKRLNSIEDNRSMCFEKFNNKIIFTKEYTEENYMSIPTNYDFYSVGSDQVWNAYFPDYSDYYLLNFLKTKNKITYSPSIGTNSIPEEKINDFKEALSKFKFLSCREEEGATLLKNILNKDVEVLIDPTLLLTSDEWSKVISKPKCHNNKKYILCYFLGMKDRKNFKIIKKYAKDHNLEIINLLDPMSKYYGTGPSEFLFLEKNAEIIFTDSFHSSVFALIFNRPFVIFKRNDEYKNMDSRLDTLISKFKLVNRRFDGQQITKENENNDYTLAYDILKKEREKSIQFIKKSLGIKK